MKNIHYWSLTIEPGWVQTALWTITEDNKAKVLSVSSPNHWEADEELVNVIDASLSNIVQALPEGAPEPSKTILGFSPSWISDGRIKEEYLIKVKKICSKLSLEPVGFVVLPEAIAFYIKTTEQTPLNAVVVGTGEETVDVSIFKLGNLIGTVTVGRSVSIFDDVVEGIVSLKISDQIPSRFIVYDGKGKDLEELKQSLITADWQRASDKVKLLHTPKVEVLDSKDKLLAVSLAGASELNQVTSLEVEAPQEKQSDLEEKSYLFEEEEHKDKDISEENLMDAHQAGFIAEKDIAQIKTAPPADYVVPETPTIASRTTKRLFRFGKPPVLPLLGKIRNKIPTQFEFGRKPIVIGVSFLIILFISGGLAWWFLPKATVAIYVASKNLEETQIVTIDPNSDSSDYSEKVLGGKIVSSKVSGEKTASTTGAKTVGDKAKGKVQIRNGTSSTISLAGGTIIIGPNDLKFRIDSAASVSAASSPSSPGATVVDVTAEDIGAEYNLAKGETFGVGNYPKSEVDGVSDSDFSGGSSREISVVSEEDKKGLESDLEKELFEKGKEEIRGSITSGENLIEDAVSSQISKKEFSHKAGDETSSLKLTMEGEVSAIIVSEDEITHFAQEVLKNKVPDGYVLRDDQIATAFSLKGKEGSTWKVEITFVANLLPEIKPEEIAAKIAGKYPAIAEDYLSSIPGFSSAEITFSPKLPGKLGTLPRVSKNITIEIVAEK